MPSSNRRLVCGAWLAGMLLCALALLFVAGVLWIGAQWALDQCLDQGGRWNHEMRKCEFRR